MLNYHWHAHYLFANLTSEINASTLAWIASSIARGNERVKFFRVLYQKRYTHRMRSGNETIWYTCDKYKHLGSLIPRPSQRPVFDCLKYGENLLSDWRSISKEAGKGAAPSEIAHIVQALLTLCSEMMSSLQRPRSCMIKGFLKRRGNGLLVNLYHLGYITVF